MITTTSPTKLFAAVKHFSSDALDDLDVAINLFISTLDADADNYYTVSLGSSYFDVTNARYVCAILYTRFEIDSEWSASLA